MSIFNEETACLNISQKTGENKEIRTYFPDC